MSALKFSDSSDVQVHHEFDFESKTCFMGCPSEQILNAWEDSKSQPLKLVDNRSSV